ncbi:oocyte zinc finger protein XlCOF8.4-like [Haliotis rubra]|uniref:oocyte zinc finger protein XlCOF8.4-like n=1 Tax=Haliotis rubra TaxID=36100 RepID=UPI001EE61108|nr:oocyte zinc finger protein XlCOF8.4-like [Haliotis rubra]
MAMKPEPMELEGEGSVYPMQLIQNETQNNRAFHIEQTDPLAMAGDINNDIDAIIASTSGSFLQSGNLDQFCEETNELKPMQEKPHSAVSEILLGREQGHPGARGKHYQDSHFPTYTIARGEVELNSKFLPKKYKCALCLYKTSYKSDLNRHMRRHANGRELVSCKDCHASFTSQSTLVFHQMKCPNSRGPTSGNVMVSCQICPYSTSYKSDLTRHMKSHYTHEFACDVCLKPFKVQALVDHHRLTVHNIVGGDAGAEGTHTSMVQHYNPYHQPTADTAPGDCVVIEDDEQEKAKPDPELLVTDDSVNDRPMNRDYVHSRPAPGLVTANSQGNIRIGQTAKQNGKTSRSVTPDMGSKSQLQRQSRVRELLSLNSSKQATVTVPIRQFCCENCRGIYGSVKELMNHKKSCLGSKTAQRIHSCSSATETQLCKIPCSTSKQRPVHSDRSTQADTSQSVSSLSSSPGEILAHPPDTGRFARLISDFDDFARKPYACALCFYRSTSVRVLSKHVENHLTGCNVDPIPESARFRVQKSRSQVLHSQLLPTHPGHSKPPVDVQKEDVSRTAQTHCELVALDETQFISNPVPARMRHQALAQTGTIRQWQARRRARVPRFTKAFACHVCSKQFTVRGLLQRHLRKMHKDDMDTGEVLSKDSTLPVLKSVTAKY